MKLKAKPKKLPKPPRARGTIPRFAVAVGGSGGRKVRTSKPRRNARPPK